jgi:hypothetical protein
MSRRTQTVTGATSLKDPPDAAPAQASTHDRLRTAGRHSAARPTTRPRPGSPQVGPGNRVFCIWQPCARHSGNKTDDSVHGMGLGDLAVDDMSIGCLGVDLCGERFFVLSHFQAARLRRRGVSTWFEATGPLLPHVTRSEVRVTAEAP